MRIYIYGTGKSAEKLYSGQLKEEIEVLGFLDSDLKKNGTAVPFAPQYKILGVKDIKNEFDFIVIASTYSEIYYNLLSGGVNAERICCLYSSAENNVINCLYEKRHHILRLILKENCIYENYKVKKLYPDGYFYSPINDLDYVEKECGKLFRTEFKEIEGINLYLEHQIKLLQQFEENGDLLGFPAEENLGFRYYSNNSLFPVGDARVLSQMIYAKRPHRIIEVGSGFSSACMMDVNDKLFGGSIKLTFIEPYPDRLNSILRKGDKIELIESALQDVGREQFESLEAGDILFIDSSHVSKVGSDVNYILFEILPILKTGVMVHFHDILYPFEYSREWIMEGRAWNESYLLRAFLQYNDQFRIVFWGSCLKKYYEKVYNSMNIENAWYNGGSIYILKQ